MHAATHFQLDSKLLSSSGIVMTIFEVPRRKEKKLVGKTKIGNQGDQVVENLSYTGVQGPPQSD